MGIVNDTIKAIVKFAEEEQGLPKSHIEGLHLVCSTNAVTVHKMPESGGTSFGMTLELPSALDFKTELETRKTFRKESVDSKHPAFNRTTIFKSTDYEIHVLEGVNSSEDFIRVYFRKSKVA